MKGTFYVGDIRLARFLLDGQYSTQQHRKRRAAFKIACKQELTIRVSRVENQHRNSMNRTSEARKFIAACLLLISCRLIASRCVGLRVHLDFGPCRPTRIRGTTGTPHACVSVPERTSTETND